MWPDPKEDEEGALRWFWELIGLTPEDLQGRGEVLLPVPEQQCVPSG